MTQRKGETLNQFSIPQQPVSHDDVLYLSGAMHSLADEIAADGLSAEARYRLILIRHFADSLLALGTLGFLPKLFRVSPQGFVEFSGDDLPERQNGNRTSPPGIVFSYHCRGAIKVWPVPEYLRREPASRPSQPIIRHCSQQARGFIDQSQHWAMPFLERPQAKTLDSLLREGSHVVLALSEFSDATEAANVIGLWWSRGVRFHISDLPDSFDNDRILLFRFCSRLVLMDEPWVDECEPADMEGEDMEGPLWM